MTNAEQERILMPTDAEMLMALAEARGESCLVDNDGAPGETAYHGGKHGVMCICGGLGYLPLYPTLREPCIGCRECQPKNNQYFRNSARQNICQGRGWVPIQQDVMAALVDIPYEIWFLGYAVSIRLHEGSLAYGGRGDTSLSRLLSALVLATAAKEKP